MPNYHTSFSLMLKLFEVKHDKSDWRRKACPLPAGMVFLVVGEVQHIVHLIRLNLNSLCPCGLIDHGPVLGVTHDYLGVSWVPFNGILLFRSRHQLVPHSVPNSSAVPLCNVSWGSGVCSVLVMSVSPCRLVLEVRLFPSPPALFWPWPVVCVRFFLPLAFHGRPGSGRVCVCNIWIDAKPLLFFLSFLQGATGSLHGCRQRSSMQLTRIWSLINSTYLQIVYLP